MSIEPRRRLGRGLDALLGAYPPAPAPDEPTARPEAGRRTVPIGSINRNPRNPRREFRREELEELAASLKQHGMVQPLVVRPAGGGGEHYEIIAGERRWRAAQMVGLHDVPVSVLDVSDREALELAIVENVQRADLNAIEEAQGYQALIEEFGYTQADLGEIIGKSRVHVTNTLRLLKLPGPVQAMLQSAKLSAGHGRALLAAADPERLAGTVVEKNLSVRETERLAQLPQSQPGSRPRRRSTKPADIAQLEKDLTAALGLGVELRHDDSGRGKIRIAYRTPEQLEAICAKLRV